MKRIAAAVIAALLAMAGEARASEPPRRVVSMNLCTDQLALMLAAPGQLISVSDWALRPSASNLTGAAAGLVPNAGSAEQIFMLRPDLVLAGEFSNRVTLTMLRRLGLRVETVPAARSFNETLAVIRRVGDLLGRHEAGEAMADALSERLDRLRARAARPQTDEAIILYPNNFTPGAASLAADALEAAGYRNAGESLGVQGVGRVSLEALVMADPVLFRTRPISGNHRGRSYESLDHPALAGLSRTGSAVIPDRLLACETPFLAEAVEMLIDAQAR